MSTVITARAAGSRFKFALLMLTGGLACAVAVGAASAATPDNDVPSIVVRYSNQTLATDQGVQQLYGRIVRAAREVCPDAMVRDLAARAGVQRCRQQAVARAIHQIDNPELAALYATSSKRG
jgi:UrcA family protein